MLFAVFRLTNFLKNNSQLKNPGTLSKESSIEYGSKSSISIGTEISNNTVEVKRRYQQEMKDPIVVIENTESDDTKYYSQKVSQI